MNGGHTKLRHGIDGSYRTYIIVTERRHKTDKSETEGVCENRGD